MEHDGHVVIGGVGTDHVNFNGERVLTSSQIDRIHKLRDGETKKYFDAMIAGACRDDQLFEEGRHYMKATREDLKGQNPGVPFDVTPNDVVVFTREGYRYFAKNSPGGDYRIFLPLVDGYYKGHFPSVDWVLDAFYAASDLLERIKHEGPGLLTETEGIFTLPPSYIVALEIYLRVDRGNPDVEEEFNKAVYMLEESTLYVKQSLML